MEGGSVALQRLSMHFLCQLPSVPSLFPFARSASPRVAGAAFLPSSCSLSLEH